MLTVDFGSIGVKRQSGKAFVHAVMGVVDSTIECSLPVLSEGSQPDVLFGLGSFRMPVIASSSLGGSDGGPARCPVDGAGVARGLNEGFDEHGCCVVAVGPVPGQAAAHDGQDVRAEVGDLDPRQYQEPQVVDLSLPFISSAVETLEFCIPTGYLFGHAQDHQHAHLRLPRNRPWPRSASHRNPCPATAGSCPETEKAPAIASEGG